MIATCAAAESAGIQDVPVQLETAEEAAPQLDLAAYADTSFAVTLADVATEELFADDSCEIPYGSDSVKYNRWFYKESVINPLQDREYVDFYDWNTVFVCWCANKIGLVEYGMFPRTCDGRELYMKLADQGNDDYGKEQISGREFSPQPSDIIFLPDKSGYRTGIVVSDTAAYVTYIQGDMECGVGKSFCSVEDLPDGTRFIRLTVTPNPVLCAYVKYFCDELGIPPAAACGLFANIQTETEGNPTALGDEGTSFGICQWRYGRWTALIRFCEERGYDWHQLSGQLEYLVYDLQTEYRMLLDMLQGCDSSPAGAYQAGFYFCLVYEMPYETLTAADRRGTVAANWIYPMLFIN